MIVLDLHFAVLLLNIKNDLVRILSLCFSLFPSYLGVKFRYFKHLNLAQRFRRNPRETKRFEWP